jgi:hypothetical protein
MQTSRLDYINYLFPLGFRNFLNIYLYSNYKKCVFIIQILTKID